jgi:beta-arabinofuranosyltransferase
MKITLAHKRVHVPGQVKAWARRSLSRVLLQLRQRPDKRANVMFAVAASAVLICHLHARGLKMAGANEWNIHHPSVTIFAAPKPHSVSPGSPANRALKSWLRLSPPVNVVLFGSANDNDLQEFMSEYGGRVKLETKFDRNFLGVPLFNSLIARCKQTNSDISLFVNSDIILLNDVWSGIARAHRDGPGWVVTGMRIDINRLPFDLGRGKHDIGGLDLDNHVKSYVRAHGRLHSYGGVDFWAWDNSEQHPLFNGTMPAFVFSRGKYDNWFTHALIHGGRRVIDATEIITSIHVNHDRQVLGGQIDDAGKVLWSVAKQSSFELFSNIYLSQLFDNGYRNQMGTAHHIPNHLVTCNEPEINNVCMLERARPASCSCEMSTRFLKTMTDPVVLNGAYQCGKISVERKNDFKIPVQATIESKPGLPHTLDQLLPQVADRNGVVVLTASTFKYHTLLMNLACRLRALDVNNLLVAALDEELYRYAFVRGLAVYPALQDASIFGMANIQAEAGCKYGSKCFRAVTKLKSREVLTILKKGYSVLWTDMDIVWMRDPTRSLLNYGPGVFAVQGNAPTKSEPPNGHLRINSGFYLARAEPATIQAFEKITEHAKRSNESEQPSFYIVLCGDKGQYRVGDHACLEPTTGLTTKFLPLDKYPNGAYNSYWNDTNLGKRRDLVILHNNWITGLDNKIARMQQHGFWYIGDAEEMSCRHSWTN